MSRQKFLQARFRILALGILLLFMVQGFIVFSEQTAPFFQASNLQPSAPAGLGCTSPSILSDPYANLTGYENYLEAMYHTAGHGFPTAGFDPPTYSISGGDYWDQWMDDAGKITTAFTEYGNCAYADKAASFIMDNSINANGFIYLPQRTVNESFSWLHINMTQLASSSFQSEFNPIQNAYFENPATANATSLQNWLSNTTGDGTTKPISGPDIALEGNQSGYTTTGHNPSAAGSATYYEALPVNELMLFAHRTSLTLPSKGDGILGNLTGEFGGAIQTSSGTGSSTSPYQFLFDSYPTLQTDMVVPANENFSFNMWLDASQALTGVTLTAKVNETCSNYSTQTTPWSIGTSTVSVGTSPGQFIVNVPTGASATTVPAGCALRFILDVEPSSGSYTFTISYDSGTYDTGVAAPYSSTINLMNAASTRYESFSLQAWPMSGGDSQSGFYVAMVTSAGTELLTSGTVTQSDIPNLVGPVYTNSSMGIGPDTSKFTFRLIRGNESKMLSSISSSSPDAILKYFEFGVTSTGDNVSAGWDSIHLWLSPPMISNTPNPANGQYLSGGYWYGTNGNIDFTNSSVFAHAQIYEQSDVQGVATANEPDTVAPFFGAPNLLSQSPLVNSLVPFDAYYNATGYNMRDVFPYNYAVSQPVYKLYLSGGNGSDIHIDMLVAADGYQNVYVWLNSTVIPGLDYYQLTENMVNYGSSVIWVQDLSLGVGALSPFSSYEPWTIYTQFPNGTLNEGDFHQDCPCQGGDANATTVPPGQNQVIWNTGPGNGGLTPPTAMLVTGINPGLPAENTNGLFIKFLNSSSLEELRFNPTIFGHSVRIGLLTNSTNGGAGVYLKPGQSTAKFVFDATPIIRTMYTEPKVLFQVFQSALTRPGVDVSMAATWGYDSYGLALLGQAQNNQTILNFDKQLWNSEWQDVSQRYNGYIDPASGILYQTHVYYRTLYMFAVAGLILYPGNETVINIARNIVQYDIVDLQNSYGLPVSQEEYGAGADLLANLFPYSTPTQQAQYLQLMTFMINANAYNTTFTEHEPLTTWAAGNGYGNFNYTSFLPSLWSDNSIGQIVFWCNHPLYAYKCAELTSGFMKAAQINGIPDLYSDPQFLVSMSLLWEITAYHPTGSAFFTEDVGFNGNSNTEVQPDAMVAMLTWMEGMQNATGAYISSLKGAGLSYIQYDTYDPTKYNSLIVGLSVPSGSNANLTINYAARGGPPEAVFDDGNVITSYSLNTTSNDIIFHNVHSEIMLLWPSSGGTKGTACVSSAPPTIQSPVIRAQIGKTANAIISASNSGDNVSSTLEGVTYDPPTGIQIATTSGIPLVMQPLQSGLSFEIQVTLSSQLKPGDYNISATSPFIDSCSNSGQVGFKITILAQTGPVTSGPSWIQWLDEWWPLLLVLIAIAFSVFAIAWRRRED